MSDPSECSLSNVDIRAATIHDIPEILCQRRAMYEDMGHRGVKILNVYTYSQFRRRGIARRLMQTMIAWCAGEGLARVALHASEDGRHLYESLGFELSNEMRLNLR
jgi:GNAT superfamily N-acetyltransferase